MISIIIATFTENEGMSFQKSETHTYREREREGKKEGEWGN